MKTVHEKIQKAEKFSPDHYYLSALYRTSTGELQKLLYDDNNTISEVETMLAAKNIPHGTGVIQFQIFEIPVISADRSDWKQIEYKSELNPLYFSPTYRLQKADEAYARGNYKEAAKNLWLAAKFAVKGLFLSHGYHATSDAGIEFLCHIGVDCLTDDYWGRRLLKMYFDRALEFQGYSIGTCYLENDGFKKKMEKIRLFIEEFSKIDGKVLQKATEIKVKELLTQKSSNRIIAVKEEIGKIYYNYKTFSYNVVIC
uniref:Uncharacterized protein n=1 Tax=Panagrolaimus sp. ES5 TaxID=591445 RepID=A0AC34G6K4_9BILA